VSVSQLHNVSNHSAIQLRQHLPGAPTKPYSAFTVSHIRVVGNGQRAVPRFLAASHFSQLCMGRVLAHKSIVHRFPAEVRSDYTAADGGISRSHIVNHIEG
jgi:hypothetical protein